MALNAAAKKYNDEQVPFTLINMLYQNEREVVAQHGARAFTKTRDLFLENLRASLGDIGLVVNGQSRDFALIGGIGSAIRKPFASPCRKLAPQARSSESSRNPRR